MREFTDQELVRREKLEKINYFYTYIHQKNHTIFLDNVIFYFF